MQLLPGVVANGSPVVTGAVVVSGLSDGVSDWPKGTLSYFIKLLSK